MTGLATATFPDGSLPEVHDVMLIAANLFAAGQETTARLLSTGLQLIGERPELQQQLRDDRHAHRRASSRRRSGSRARSRASSDCHGSRRRSAASTFLRAPRSWCYNGAANRDPRQFERPERAPARPGERAPAPRVRVRHPHLRRCAARPRRGRRHLQRVLLDRMADIRISEAEHGPADARRYEYTPIYMLRGLERLHLEFTPVAPERRSTRRDDAHDARAPARGAVPRRAARVAGRAPAARRRRRGDARGGRRAARVAADARTPGVGSASTGRSSTAGAARRWPQVAIYNEELAARTRRRSSGAPASASSGRR